MPKTCIEKQNQIEKYINFNNSELFKKRIYGQLLN